MKKRRLMLDGARIGAELEGTIEISKSEAVIVRNILLKAGAEIDEFTKELSVTVSNELKGSDSKLMVSIRGHYHKENKKVYLNITGNPLAFVTGSSTYGYAEADRVMITAYRICLEALGTFPARIMKQIADRNIFIYNLEFAVYTNKIPDKEQLLSDWNRMYSVACYVNKDGKGYTMVTKLLGIRHEKAHQDHKSLCLRIRTRDDSEDCMMLMAYDKADEMRNKAKKRGLIAVVPDDVEDRLRLDLNFCRGWFRSHQVDGRKLFTLKDLVRYIEKNYEASWPRFLRAEFERAIDKTKLFKMWRFDVEKGLKSADKLTLGMSVARSLLRASSLETARCLAGDLPMPRVDRNPHDYEIVIDTSRVL